MFSEDKIPPRDVSRAQLLLLGAMAEANPSIYFGLSLGVTFPINIPEGISICTWAAVKFLG